MKKTIYKAFTIAGLMFLMVVVNACLKDDSRFTDFTTVGSTVEFIGQVPGKSVAVSFPDPTSAVGVPMALQVHQAGPTATSSDLTLTLGFSQAGVDLYNLDKSHVVGTALPADAYSFPATVTIKAGKDSLNNDNRTANITLLIYPNKVPSTPGVNYVLSLGITAVSPAVTISANNGVILFNFYKNAYDGLYHRTGTLVRPATPDAAIDEHDPLTTVNATESSGLASFFGNPGLSFFVDVAADNSVTINADPAALYPITGGGTFDPATVTFMVQYTYTSSATRNFTETWVHD